MNCCGPWTFYELSIKHYLPCPILDTLRITTNILLVFHLPDGQTPTKLQHAETLGTETGHAGHCFTLQMIKTRNAFISMSYQHNASH